jgi:hypothetical protein
MRWFIGLLFALGALAATWPGVQLLWEMETGAAQIDIVHADGVRQHTQSGPRSYWPAWAPFPQGARHVVQSSYAPAPQHAATGYAKLSGFASAARLQADYAAQLARAGWTVEQYHHRVSLPEVPPRPALLCHVIATKGGRGLLFTASDDAPEMSRLFWLEGKHTAPMGSVLGPCR